MFLLILILTVGFSYQQTLAKTSASSEMTHAEISVLPESGTTFTTQIILHVAQNYPDWRFGFFMFHVISNPKISKTMQICKLNTSTCMTLAIDANKKSQTIDHFVQPDLSLGHITILKPQTKFELQKGESYVITIKGLKNIPQNISMMPQKLFIYNPAQSKVMNIVVNSYTNTSYDSFKIESQINAKIVANWDNAKPVNIHSPVVPLPRYISYESLFLTTNRAKTNIRFLSCTVRSEEKLCSQIKNQMEGYIIKVAKSGVDIYANNQAGRFYASQTLQQLLNSNDVPFQTIIDYPRFKYRGIMLDAVRHFFSYNELKRFIDVMAAHKLNTLHLHLADDEGWRLELPNYPRLTKIGATRGFGTSISAANLIDDKFDITNLSKEKYADVKTKYTGYYTIKQIKDLIKYANARQITIIPEIEMPGHARAMKKAMPEAFFDTADKSDAYSVQGYNDNVLPACKYGVNGPFTKAINGVIQDIAKLFAGQTTPYFVANEVSLSGDELAEGSLSGYPLCKSGIWANLDTIQLEHMFFKQLATQLPQYKLSGWQQLVQNDNGVISGNVIAANNVGHLWAWMPTTNKPVNGYKLVTNLTKAGYSTVLVFADYTYFDIRYSPKFYEPGLYWSTSYADTNKVLQSGQIISKNLSNASQVDGLEGALWSELLPSNEHLWYMALPKMSALAEAAWSQESDLNWQSLANRLGCGKAGFLAYLNKNYHVKYRGYPNGIKLEVPPNTICSF